MEKYKKTTVLLATILAAAVTSANALTEAQVQSVKGSFQNVPRVEIAPKAARIVAQTPAEDKTDMAVLIVNQIAKKNPSVTVAVVSAICTVAPETSAKVAAVAAKAVKNHAEAIMVAAAKAAPEYVGNITQSVSAAVPTATVTTAAAPLTTPKRTMATAKQAITASATGVTITYGSIQGVNYPVAPSTTLLAPVIRYDPRRYPAP